MIVRADQNTAIRVLWTDRRIKTTDVTKVDIERRFVFEVHYEVAPIDSRVGF